jgi:hypothetical protein
MATATKAAESLLVDRLRLNPGSLVFPRVADHFRKAGQTDGAIEVCTKGLTLHPDCVSGHIVLGRCYLDQKNLEQAIGALLNVCRLDRRNTSAIKMLADIFLRQGLSKKAGDLYSLLAKADPYDARFAEIAGRHHGSGKSDLFEILGLTPGTSSDRIVIQETPTPKEKAVPLEDSGFLLGTTRVTADAGAAVEEMLTEATTISGSDVSERLTALFGEGPSAKVKTPSAPLSASDETVTSFPVKPQIAPSVSSRSEATSGKETIKMPAVNEPPKTKSPLEVELAETMIIDADAAMLLQGETGMSGIKVKDTSPEAAGTAIDEAKTQELAGGALTQPADAFAAEELMEKPQESLEDILSDASPKPETPQVETAASAAILEPSEEATAAVQTGTAGAEDTISGDDVADRLDHIFEETKNKGKKGAPPSAAEKTGVAIAGEPAEAAEQSKTLPAGMAGDSDIEKTATFLPAADDTISGDDVAERIEGIFKEKKKKQKKDSQKAAEAVVPLSDKKEETDTSDTRTEDKGSSAKARIDTPLPAAADGSDSVIETASLTSVNRTGKKAFPESKNVETLRTTKEESGGPERTVVEMPPQKFSDAGPDQGDQFEETLIFDTPEYVRLAGNKTKEPGKPAADKIQPPGDDTFLMEKTLRALPREEIGIDTQDISSAGKETGDSEKESTAVFEEFSPATVTETDGAAAIDRNKNPDDIPDQVLTPTLANIYLQQGLPQSALKIYRRLAAKDPANTEFPRQISELEKTIAAGLNNLKPPPPKRGGARKKSPRRPRPDAAPSSPTPQDAGDESMPRAGTRRPRKKTTPKPEDSAGGQEL